MSDLGEYVAVHSAALLTFCTALTGDPAEASALAERASRAADSRAVRRGDVGVDVAVWRAAVHEYVAARRDHKQARARAVRVLRELEDLEPRDIAPLVGRRPRWVSRQLTRTPLRRPDGLEAVPSRRTGRWLALAGVVALLATVAVVAARQDRPAATESGAAPTVPGLIPWPARGELGRDRAFHQAATAVWRASDAQVAQTYVLWAGPISGGRVALLQAQVGVERLLAVVGDGDRGLRVIRVTGIPVSPKAVLIEYGGPAPTEHMVDGTTMRTLRLLVAPGVSRVERRGAQLSSAVEQLSPGTRSESVLGTWLPLLIGDGLSDPWLDPSGGLSLSAVRFGGDSADALLLPPAAREALVPLDVEPWSGPPIREATPRPADIRADEVLVLAQVLRSANVRVRAIASTDVDGVMLYASQALDVTCPDCYGFYEVARDPFLVGSASPRVRALNGLASAAGTVVIEDQYAHRLIGPPKAARCVFGTHVPPPPDKPEQPTALIGLQEFDGSYVCVDAQGRVVDRAESYGVIGH